MSKSDLPAMFKSAPEFHYFHSDVSDLVKFNISFITTYAKIIFERRDDELHLYSKNYDEKQQKSRKRVRVIYNDDSEWLWSSYLNRNIAREKK